MRFIKTYLVCYIFKLFDVLYNEYKPNGIINENMVKHIGTYRSKLHLKRIIPLIYLYMCILTSAAFINGSTICFCGVYNRNRIYLLRIFITCLNNVIDKLLLIINDLLSKHRLHLWRYYRFE